MLILALSHCFSMFACAAPAMIAKMARGVEEAIRGGAEMFEARSFIAPPAQWRCVHAGMSGVRATFAKMLRRHEQPRRQKVVLFFLFGLCCPR